MLSIGYTNTELLPVQSGLADFTNYEMVYLPASWASNTGNPDTILAKSEDYKQYVYNGGRLLLEQPNPHLVNNGKILVTVLPVPVLFYAAYTTNDFPPVIADTSHFLTRNLGSYDMPSASDSVSNLDSSYHVLSYGKYSHSPTLFIREYGSGKVLVHTSSPNTESGYRLLPDMYGRIMEWMVPIITSLGSETTSPESYIELMPNYPNPFNPVTKISYILHSATTVRLHVYDILGREVRH